MTSSSNVARSGDGCQLSLMNKTKWRWPFVLVLSALGAWCLNLTAFNAWLSYGPPLTSEPPFRNLYLLRAIFCFVLAVVAIGAAAFIFISSILGIRRRQGRMDPGYANAGKYDKEEPIHTARMQGASGPSLMGRTNLRSLAVGWLKMFVLTLTVGTTLLGAAILYDAHPRPSNTDLQFLEAFANRHANQFQIKFKNTSYVSIRDISRDIVPTNEAKELVLEYLEVGRSKDYVRSTGFPYLNFYGRDARFLYRAFYDPTTETVGFSQREFQ